ncbi:carboxymuconolactone decarboxylase [Roseivivax marinus]|uniref:Carboxymuconolactone decarboxylase n=1 Tax=Roseivivax marinus TaxID=1379903 RepID=W4HIT1_9RHOB|nr:carboxymuconolactone decarboxylase family protein [Roseivivax marinus]ETW12056.1 carboxymuconolactone decarboxylase [Roseivivax marinus]
MTWPPQRLGPPDPSGYSPRQQEIHDAIAAGPRGGVRGPLAVWLHRPELASAAQALGRYCRYDTSLDPRLSELAILVTARAFDAEYEWFAHKPPALKAGLDPDIIEAIRTMQQPYFHNLEEAVVYEVAWAAHTEKRVDDALYDRAAQVLGKGRLVDLVGLLGYYTLISLTINIFRVSPPEGTEPELTDD